MVRLPHRGWLLDLDGTIYVGEALVPGAVETIAALRGDGRRVVFLSNKPLQTRADYAAKLTRLGVPAAAEDVINSSLGLARHLATLEVGAPGAVTGETVSVIVGKPSPIILEVALARLGVDARDAVIVGDRIETDIVMGKRLGLATVLVLSGVTRADDPRVAEIAPDLVLPSIRDLIR